MHLKIMYTVNTHIYIQKTQQGFIPTDLFFFVRNKNIHTVIVSTRKSHQNYEESETRVCNSVCLSLFLCCLLSIFVLYIQCVH